VIGRFLPQSPARARAHRWPALPGILRQPVPTRAASTLPLAPLPPPGHACLSRPGHSLTLTHVLPSLPASAAIRARRWPTAMVACSPRSGLGACRQAAAQPAWSPSSFRHSSHPTHLICRAQESHWRSPRWPPSPVHHMPLPSALFPSRVHTHIRQVPCHLSAPTTLFLPSVSHVPTALFFPFYDHRRPPSSASLFLPRQG
jgi:hypothetical protein